MKIKQLGLVATLAFMLSGCAVSFVSQYDEVTDKSVSNIHSNIGTYFYQKNPGKPGIEADGVNFYAEIRQRVRELKLRASAIPNNSITLEQIDLLSKQIDSLEKFDKSGFSALQAPVIISQFDTVCGAILKLELAKKRD